MSNSTDSSIGCGYLTTARFRITWLLLGTLVTISAGGCGRTAADQLVGRWKGKLNIDKAEVDRQLKSENTPFAKQMGKFLVDGLKSMETSVEFRGDGTMSMSMAAGLFNRSSNGTWEVVTEDGDLVTLKSVDDKGNEQQFELRFDGYDAFEMKSSGSTPAAKMGTLQFERVIE